MQSAVRFAVALTLAVPVTTSAVWAARAPNVVPESARVVAGGRAVGVLVAQSEIKTDINPSNLAVATGGGMLGGLLAASQNASRTKKAEAAIGPVRDALAGFDVEKLSLDTTRKAIGAVGWVNPTKMEFGKDSSLLGKSNFLDAASGPQAAFIEYSYDLSPDFTSARVVARIQLANKALPAGETKSDARFSAKHLAYEHTITSVVTLPGAGKDLAANAALWAADGGKTAKAAITMAFADIGALLPQALGLTADDVTRMNAKDKRKAVSGGFSGRVQRTDASGDLLWSNGFISVRPLPAA